MAVKFCCYLQPKHGSVGIVLQEILRKIPHANIVSVFALNYSQLLLVLVGLAATNAMDTK